MLGCGLRRAEVCELRVKQVSFKNRSAKIIGKGNKERTIYFPDAVDEVLKIWFEFRQLNKNDIDAGFVFGRIDNRQHLHLDIPLDPSSVTRIIENLSLKPKTWKADLHLMISEERLLLASSVKT